MSSRRRVNNSYRGFCLFRGFVFFWFLLTMSTLSYLSINMHLDVLSPRVILWKHSGSMVSLAAMVLARLWSHNDTSCTRTCGVKIAGRHEIAVTKSRASVNSKIIPKWRCCAKCEPHRPTGIKVCNGIVRIRCCGQIVCAPSLLPSPPEELARLRFALLFPHCLGGRKSWLSSCDSNDEWSNPKR